jgi:hypothetical protein
VHFSRHSGDVASAVRAMDEAGASVAVVTNLLDVERPGVTPADDLRGFGWPYCGRVAAPRTRVFDLFRSAIASATIAASSPTPNRSDDFRLRRK